MNQSIHLIKTYGFQILLRYFLSACAGLVLALILSLSGLPEMSGPFFAQNIYPSLFILMLPSVLLWHLVAQLSPILSQYKHFTETKSATIAAVLMLLLAYYSIEGALLSKTDTSLFAGSFYLAALASGLALDYLKNQREVALH